MKTFIYSGYKIELEFIREKYGLYRWDYNFIKNGEVVTHGCDRNLQNSDAKLAIIEILMEDLSDEYDDSGYGEYNPDKTNKNYNNFATFIQNKFNLKSLNEAITDEEKDNVITYLLELDELPKEVHTKIS